MSKLNTYPAKSSYSKTGKHSEEVSPVFTEMSSAKRKKLRNKKKKTAFSDRWKVENPACKSAEFVAIRSID